MSQRRRRPSARRPRGHLSGEQAGGPDVTRSGRCWSRCCRAAEAGAPAEVDETAAHRRDPVAGPDRCAVAGRAVGLRALADGVRPVPALAAGRDLAADPDRVAGPGGRGRADHLGRVRGFHGRAGAPARGRGAAKGDLQAEPPGGMRYRARSITGWAGPVAGSPPRCTWPASSARNRLSILITAGQRGDSPQFQPVLERIHVPRAGRGGPGPAAAGPGR